MSRSRVPATLKRDSSYTTVTHLAQPKKILPPPIDPKLSKQIKMTASSTKIHKSPIRKTKNSKSISNIGQIQSSLNQNSQNISQNSLDLTAQKIHLSRQHEQSRITNASTQGSYSQSSFNDANKHREKCEIVMEHNHHHQRTLSNTPVINHEIGTKIQSNTTSKVQANQYKRMKQTPLQQQQNISPLILLNSNQEKENQANNHQKILLSQQPLTNTGIPPLDKTKRQIEEIKQKQQQILNRPISKCSFKDSFVDSDNFMNVEEKLNEETSILDCTRQPRQKSLHELIKEKFIGPIMATHGNSSSLLKRNILVTGSNCSGRSSTCSLKSSFLPMSRAQNTKSSFQSNQCCIDTNTFEQDELDENVTFSKHCCENINQYSFMPKTIFNEIVTEITQSQRISNANQKNRFSSLVTSVPQNLFTVERPSKNLKKDFTAKTNDSFSNNSPYCDDQQFSRPSDNRNSYLINEVKEEEFSEEVKDESSATNNQQEDIIEFLQSDTHKMHLIQTLQSLQYVKYHLQPAPIDQLKQKKVKLPQFRKPWITKTIVFDLDETLVHCVEDIYNNKVDQLINVKFPNGDVATAGINIRPYAVECLRRASELFQVVVFTASHSSYADVVLDILDPNHEIFEKRLYRDSCIRSQDGVYVKDLRIFEPYRKLEDIVIVDNAVYSFGYQLENGIPIIPFYNDKEDEELLHLTQYLECLVRNGGDVREHNKKAFQLRELQELDVQQFLQSMIYDNQLILENKQKQQLAQTQKQGNTQGSQWEVLNVDTSVINEEPNEDEESSIQESSRLIKKKYQLQFIQDNGEDSENEIENYEECSQRIVTNTSILERESFEQ